MKIFYAVFVSVILVLIVITMVIRSDSTSFYGIADAQEMIINDEFAVEINKIFVVPGQRVRAGDTLLEVKRPELDLKIAELRSEVLQSKSERDVLINDLRGQIRGIEAQLETNKKLMSELRSINMRDKDDATAGNLANPAAEKLKQLKKALQLALDSSNISGYDRPVKEPYDAHKPLDENVKGLQNELNMLMEVKQNSHKIALISGLIGAVSFKEGEIVSPFVPICSLHTESPSFVRGYIHENVYSSVSVGQKVRVSSFSNKSLCVTGEVTGVGSRIVEYPIRLRKSPEILMWGREVIIKIPANNQFLLGEKVMIAFVTKESAKKNKSAAKDFFNRGGAWAAEGPAALDLMEISAKIGTKIEASGVLYVPDLDKYIVISDDTDGKRPVLFIMNAACTIENEAVIAGLDTINDMEGIARNEQGDIFVLTSQSYNKKGKLSKSRTLFIRVKRDGEAFSLTGSILLTDALTAAALKDPEKPWAVFIRSALADSTLDIEGLACRKNTLYFGVKNPLLNGNAVIVSIDDCDSLFKHKAVGGSHIALWKQWKLADPKTGAASGISGLDFSGDDLYITAVAESNNPGRVKKSGTLWRYRPDQQQPDLLRQFPGLKPEGVAVNGKTGTILIAFDNGSKKPSQATTLKVVK